MKDFDHWFAEQGKEPEPEGYEADTWVPVHGVCGACGRAATLDKGVCHDGCGAAGLQWGDYEEYDDGTYVIGNAIYIRCCGCGKEFEYPLGRDEIDPAEITNPCCGGSPRCCP